MWRGLIVWMVVVVVVVVVVPSDGEMKNQQKEPRERRLSHEEREEVFNRLNRQYSAAVPVCIPSASPPGKDSKPFPPVPTSFTTEVEIAHQEEGKMKILYGDEAYDGLRNRGVLQYELTEGVSSRPYDKQEVIHYNAPQDKALIITLNTACDDEGAGNCDPKKSCKARKLWEVDLEMLELFGLGRADGDTGYYGVSGILQWAPKLNYEYKGQKLCRRMKCDLYEVCLKNEKDGTTALISYYWSLKDTLVNGNKEQVIVAIEVISMGILEPYFTRAVKQRYDFYAFFSNIRPDPDKLEPPADVYCSSRDSILDPPKTPRFFSYNSEAVTPITFPVPGGDNETQLIELTVAFSHYGYYDWYSKVALSDYKPWYIFGDENKYEHETRLIHDFNQGLSYSMEIHLDQCRVQLIENRTSGGDVVVSDNGTVTMLPPWMFVDLDGDWQYNGMHESRGVDADVWVGQKNLLSFLLRENYVAYYASPLVIEIPLRAEDELDIYEPRPRQAIGGGSGRGMDAWKEKVLITSEEEAGTGEGERKSKRSNDDVKSMDLAPLRLEKYLTSNPGIPHLRNNIYDYQTQPPLTHTIDLSLCYNDTRRRHFLIQLPGDTIEQVRGLNDNLLHATQMALSEVAVISPLRINRPMLEFRDGKTYVLFTILPLPPLIGDAPGADRESTLDAAASYITSAVNSDKMTIIVHLEDVFSFLEPVFVGLHVSSIMEVSRGIDNTYSFTTDQGYGPGDMAGLGIGLLIAGVLVGVVVCMAVQRSHGNKQGLPRVTMARKAPVTASNSINISANLTSSDI